MLEPRLAVISFLGLLCAAPHPAFAQGAWPEDCKLVRMAALPMTFKAGHVMIPAGINGKDVAFIVDTGGFATALSRKTVTDLGIVSHRMNSVIIRDVGGKIADEYVRVENFRIGQLQRGGVDLSVMEAMREADGLIAPDILRNYDVEFDFGGGQFSLFRPHPCADHAVYWTGAYAVLPFSVVHNGRALSGGANVGGVMNDAHIRVPVTLDGQETYAVIDTGAPTSVISMQAAARMFGLDVSSPNVRDAGKLAGGSGGEVKSYSYPFKTLTMGGVTADNPRIRLSEGRNFLENDFASLLLGMDVLRQLHLYIAYREGKLYITGADAR